jgi:hypothetical protein
MGGIVTQPILLPDGTAAAPSVAFASDTNTGIYSAGADVLGIALNGNAYFNFSTSGLYFANAATYLNPIAANTLAIVNGNTPQAFSTYGGFGAYWQIGSATELLTIAAAASTDTAANLLPANSIIESVVVRVTTVIPTAATFTVGDATIAARFATGVSTAANTTAVGLTHSDLTGTSGPKQVSAAKIRITPNASPGAATGVVRITVFYRTFVAPTS